MLVLAAAALPRPTQIALCSTGLTCIFLYVQHDLVRSKNEQYRFAFRKTLLLVCPESWWNAQW
jgi:hypothetical protein